MQKKNIQDAIMMAKKLRSDLEIEGIGVDLDVIIDLINKNNYVNYGDQIIVKEIDLKELGKHYGKNISGFIKRVGNNVYIGIESDEAPFRKRFTLAHELGHYILHPQKGDFEEIDFREKIDFTGQGKYSTDPREQEANAFAAELLMPEEQVREYFNIYHSHEILAYIFGVSYEAMKNRLDNLGLGRW